MCCSTLYLRDVTVHFVYNMCHVTFTLQVYYLMGVGGGDGGRVTGKNAAKPVTTIRDRVRTIASVNQLDILDKGPLHLNIHSSNVYGHKN